MDKRDIPRSRNANELERKYNLGSILEVQTAVKQTEEGLTATQNEIETFIGNTTNQLEEMLGTQDTYYMSGVPTLLTLPTTEWTNLEEHDGDLYYDKETGRVYRFVYGETSSWEEITTPTLASTLAIANASNDVLDGKRTTFLEQPQPPYNCGDIWLNNGVIYVCQIGRNSGTYQTDDFIKASEASYSEALGDNYNLTVSAGKVTKLIAENDSITLRLANEITGRETLIRATNDNAGVEIGLNTSPVKSIYKNDGMYIQENGQSVAYFKNNKAYNTNLEITNTFILGNFTFKPRDNGNLSLIYTGGND
jgi:phage-related protein